jgi:PAS domain S-box-containing protein
VLQLEAPSVESTAAPAPLRRCLRDIVALSTLPALWTQAEAREIAESLGDALLRVLDCNFIYVRAKPLPGPVAAIALIRAQREYTDEYLAALQDTLESWLGQAVGNQRGEIRDPGGKTTFALSAHHFSYTSELGVLIAGSSHRGFPNELESLALGVGANQAAIAFQRYAAEQRERASLEPMAHLAAIVASSDDAIISKTLDGMIKSWNAAAERIFGYSAAEAIGQSITLIIPPERRHEEERILAAIRRGERIEHFETVRVAKDGRQVEVALTVSPIRNAAGTVIGASKISRDITARKKREALLHEREEQLRLATGAAEVGLWDVDLLHDTLFWPARVKAMFGISPEVPVSMADFYAGLHAEDRERTSAAFAAALDPQRRALYDVEYRTVGKEDGLIRWVAAKGRGVFDATGRCVRVLGTAIDITDRKNTEEQLRRREAWLGGQKEAFQAAVNGAPLNVSLGILIRAVVDQFDAEARCAFYLADREGKTLRHVAGMSDEYARCVDGFKIGPESLACGLATGQPVMTRDVREEPRWQPWLWLAEQYGYRGCWSFPVETSTGKIVGTFAMYFAQPREASAHDRELAAAMTQAAAIIVSRHQEAEELARVARELAQQRHELQTMLELLPVGIAIANDPLGNDIRFAPRFAQLLGIEASQNVSFSGPNAASVPFRCVKEGVDIAAEALPMQVAARSGREVRDVELDLLLADGRVLNLMVSAAPLLDHAGNVRGAIGALVDVTALKRIQRQLEQADHQKDEFLAMLAHELRNPLAPISHASELLTRMLSEDADSHTVVNIIKRQAAHLTRLVDDLLDIGRITQGRIQLQRRPLDLATVVTQAVETIEPQVREQQHRLTVTSTGYDTLYVNGDYARLVQCVVNILTNAAKYTDPGGQISVCTRAEGASALIEVSDNGAGIAPGLLPRVFDLFVQSERTLDRAKGGLGIGLSVVKRLVEMHEGEVSAHSEGPGRGSTFVLRLPRIAHAEVDSSPAPFKAPRYRVMIVDDNRDAADSLSMLLKFAGHDTQVAYSPHQALERLEATPVDVALLDIGLPHMSGYELAERLRALPQLRATRLVALTGYGQAEDRQRAQAAGFHDHLVKPVDPLALERVLAGLPASQSA